MKKQNNSESFSLPNPYPHIISALDQYYGIWDSYEKGKENKGKSRSSKNKSKKLKILITTFWEYPLVGGLQNYIADLKAGLEAKGHQVDVIAPNQFPEYYVEKAKPKIVKENKNFYKQRYGSYNDRILSNSSDLQLFEYMLGNINLKQYDIIHAQDRFTANVMGRLNESYQKPLLFTPHGFMTHTRLKFNLIKSGSVEEAYYLAIDRQAIKAANHLVVLCELFRPILKKLGAKDEKMTTVYTGIDFQAQERIRNKEKTVITCVSRLRPRKGHKYLLEAFSLIKNQFTNVELRIVGDGEMREELENQARVLQLNDVVFLGSRKDIPELLSQSDIFVLPTTSDTLPISVIEAMFAGQAIITTNCGGIPEIIQDQQTGLIVNPADSKQLAEKMLLLLQDKTLRTNLADNARSYAQKHLTISNMVTKIEQIYFSLLRKGGL
ncbi:glycosyltransferase family 4 protein [Neobacillus cucumis]|uniref:glycosyltransferase family 4 protein n=1 Tax=Neobacillus cucumis TaxID=1740721 RepID=UPI002853231F|nr:glycosyltransferase family 4 protein [Neobacillus cucumis]MDR4946651.1 glycosyltransferase family 4 protein [Neobacillus cucumis]